MHKKEIDKEVVGKIYNYFDSQIFGSYELVLVGLVDESLINDIDIAVMHSDETRVHHCLIDNGYKQTKKDYYGKTPSAVYEKPGYKDIHILYSKDPHGHKQSAIEVLQGKILRVKKNNNIEQLKQAIERIENQIERRRGL